MRHQLNPQLMYTLTASVVVVSETGQLLEGPLSTSITINATTTTIYIRFHFNEMLMI